MAEETNHIDFKEIAGSPHDAEALRLTRRKGAAVLIVSGTGSNPSGGAHVLFSMALAAATPAEWRTALEATLVLPVRPRWDAAPDSTQQLEFAYERAGGATNALILQSVSVGSRFLEPPSPGASFTAPRFARPSGDPPQWLTTVVDSHRCLAFPVEGGAYRTLAEADECLLLHLRSGFLLITKSIVPGPVRGSDIAPGMLQIRRLDLELHGAALPVDVFAGPVFEFDADLMDNHIVIAATTTRGVALASAPVSGTKFTSKEYPVPMPLTSPALVAAGPAHPGKALLGALDSDPKRGARVLLAHISVP